MIASMTGVTGRSQILRDSVKDIRTETFERTGRHGQMDWSLDRTTREGSHLRHSRRKNDYDTDLIQR